MSRKLPTADELGEMLQAGEITRDEAIEIMDQRARDEAFKNLYNPGAQAGMSGGDEARDGDDETGAAPEGLAALRKRARLITGWVIVTILILIALAVIVRLTS